MLPENCCYTVTKRNCHWVSIPLGNEEKEHREEDSLFYISGPKTSPISLPKKVSDPPRLGRVPPFALLQHLTLPLSSFSSPLLSSSVYLSVSFSIGRANTVPACVLLCLQS